MNYCMILYELLYDIVWTIVQYCMNYCTILYELRCDKNWDPLWMIIRYYLSDWRVKVWEEDEDLTREDSAKTILVIQGVHMTWWPVFEKINSEPIKAFLPIFFYYFFFIHMRVIINNVIFTKFILLGCISRPFMLKETTGNVVSRRK